MQLLDIETKLDQVVSENRLLAEAKGKAEENLEEALYNQQRGSAALKELSETSSAEIGRLKGALESAQKEVARQTEASESTSALNASLITQNHKLRTENTNRDQQLEEQTRQLETLGQQHEELTSGMEAIVRHEIGVALEEKNAQLQHLMGELLSAKEQIRTLQQQIIEEKPSDIFLVTRDEDYFKTACQALYENVRGWVLIFSKFSDGRKCRLLHRIEDDTTKDLVDSTILDDTDVDYYLSDRIKRRDIFMSIVMKIVWEHIFARYLFGMDLEQRQRLKGLEKTLADVGESHQSTLPNGPY
jgi:myosin heavy subunit